MKRLLVVEARANDDVCVMLVMGGVGGEQR